MTYVPQNPEIQELVTKLDKVDSNKLFQSIVDLPFGNKMLTISIDLGIIVLLIENEDSNTLDRVALSNTELAKGAVKVSAKPFHEIKIPLSSKDNALVLAIKSGQHKLVSDWQFLFTPILKPEEARLNQLGASIECSLVVPLNSTRIRGAMIFSFYQPENFINEEHISFAKTYVDIVSKKLDNSFKS